MRPELVPVLVWVPLGGPRKLAANVAALRAPRRSRPGGPFSASASALQVVGRVYCCCTQLRLLLVYQTCRSQVPEATLRCVLGGASTTWGAGMTGFGNAGTTCSREMTELGFAIGLSGCHTRTFKPAHVAHHDAGESAVS